MVPDGPDASSEAGPYQAGAEQAGAALGSGMVPRRDVFLDRGLVGLDLGVEGGIDGLECRLVGLEVGGDLGDLSSGTLAALSRSVSAASVSLGGVALSGEWAWCSARGCARVIDANAWSMIALSALSWSWSEVGISDWSALISAWRVWRSAWAWVLGTPMPRLGMPGPGNPRSCI